MTRDWFSLALAGGLTALTFAAAAITGIRARRAARRAHVLKLLEPYEQQLHDEAVIRQALVDEAEYIVRDQRLSLYGPDWGGAWPGDLCAYPPCDAEENWICSWHDPRGRRLRYGPEPVIGIATDLPEPSDPRWFS